MRDMDKDELAELVEGLEEGLEAIKRKRLEEGERQEEPDPEEA